MLGWRLQYILSLSPPCQLIEELVFLPGEAHSSALKNWTFRTMQGSTADLTAILISTLHFLKEEFSTYSESACLVDCVHSTIARECSCLSARSFYRPDTFQYSQLPDCTLEDICCILDALTSPSNCPYSVACTSIRYEATVSYSYFPAEYISQELAHSLNTMNSLADSAKILQYCWTLPLQRKVCKVAMKWDLG